MRRVICGVLGTFVLPMLMAVVAGAQTQDQYLDVFIARVKPEKRAEFDVLAKKWADANRRHKGETFLAYQVEYGEQNTVYFVSTRSNYAAIEQAMLAFSGALKEAYGDAAAGKMEQDLNNCLASSRAELRRRRWDLSWNVPADPAAAAQMPGESRWIRTVMVRVRPGHVDDFEAQVRALKEGFERSAPGQTTLVSQSAAGQQGTVFYFSALRSSLAGYDNAPALREVLGDQGYQRYLKASAENVLSTETLIGRFLPELSNPPEPVAAAQPDFWNPKPAAAPKPKAKPKPPKP